MNLTGKVALVTGGAKRVGRAVALRLAGAGCRVALTYRRSEDEARGVVEQIEAGGGDAMAIHADLADPAVVDHVDGRLRERFTRLDVLVHNASVFQPTPWGELTTEAWHRHMTINALAPMRLTQRLADLLAAEEGGRVIHFVDIHVMGRPRKGYAAYSASKAALLDLTRTLARELAPRVTVNAIAPGVVAWAEDMSESERQAYLARTPLERAGTPDDAAEAVLFLARGADYLTGEVIRVDGGRWLT